ncbi:MAG: hemerythrin domain-containing protein [bacterium]
MIVKGWNKALYTGISEIDTQHLQMYDYAKKFLEMDHNGADSERINFFISKLNEAWQKHIAFEENFMQQASYPDLEDHKTEHVRIAKEIIAFVKNSKSISELGESLDNLIESWLGKHIINFDKKFAGWLKEQKEKKV